VLFRSTGFSRRPAADSLQDAARGSRLTAPRFRVILVAFLSVSCPSPLPVEVSAFAGTRRYTISVDTLGLMLPISVSADSAWKLLPGVYASLGLPLDENDPAAKRLGTCWKRVRGRLAGSPLSRYLDCGELRQMPNADRNDVDILVPELRAAGQRRHRNRHGGFRLGQRRERRRTAVVPIQGRARKTDSGRNRRGIVMTPRFAGQNAQQQNRLSLGRPG